MSRAFALLLSLGLALCAVQGTAQSDPVAAKRIVVEQDVDFYGSDLRSIFDTTFDACRAACLNDATCAAFTFNTRSGSCFPKRGVERRDPYAGALSGVVIAQSQAVLDRARGRAADLGFLRPADLTEARAQAEALPIRYPSDGTDVDALRDAATAARASGDRIAALRYRGVALVLTDDAAQWRAYAQDALALRVNDAEDQRRLRASALPAAINAYLRAETAPERIASLAVMAQALEQQRRGRDMIPALRLADTLAPTPQIAAALNDAIGKYGFRIAETQVDSDAASPRICANFSEPLAKGVDYAPYVQLPGVSFAAEAQDSQLCIEGVSHGSRYQLTLRAGLPAASGESLAKDTTLTLYVRDRAAAVRFPGRAYVLPKAAGASVPVITTNLTEVSLSLHRVSDRNLRQMIADNYFGRPLNVWEAGRFDGDLAEQVWSGTGEVEQVLNTEVTTLLPMGDAAVDLPAGVYALQARVKGADPYEVPGATQWFVISDLGLATLSGADGLHVFVRSLASAEARSGVTVSLISRANQVLARAQTDAQGYARFALEISGGRGAAAPALVIAETGDPDQPDDLVFLSLTDPEFDLSDRGVEGREAGGPIDVFLATDRGAYRAGETIHATALSRDGESGAIAGLPLTAILTRPDGVEYSRITSDGGVAGGHVFDLPVGASVPRGTWNLAVHADPEAPPLQQTRLLVEDFLPERIDFSIAPPEGAVRLGGPAAVLVLQADYLFGAPGADLPIEGEVVLRAAESLDQWPGYSFGLYDERFEPRYAGLEAGRTDANGQATLPLDLPEVANPVRPLEAVATLRLSEGSGRPVERRVTLPVVAPDPVIGIRPAFDGTVPEGTEARFDVVGVAPDGSAAPMRVRWTLNRVETTYQWYSRYGSWEWEPVTRRTRIAQSDTALGLGPQSVTAPVDWGSYELVVERTDGPYAAASVAFSAGWYAAATATATAAPDLLDVSLDRPAYRAGDTAFLRIVPRTPGKVLITVVSNRLVAMQTVAAGTEPVQVALPVTDEWGAGAYVTATLIQPMDQPAGRNPTRALGLSYAAVDPGAAKLTAAFVMPGLVRPRAPLDVVLRVDGAESQTVWATIAAVDQGILNLTGHQPPDASGHYFGQRRLGMALRDLYGRLIDGQTGAPGRLRSGGDASARMRTEAPPPTEDLVASFSGPVQVGADGTARTTFDLPSFNGKVRLMAVVWSDTGVGEAEAEVLVRDPVVVTAALPRFLAPGDSGRLLLEIVHADGPEGSAALAITAEGVTLDSRTIPAQIQVAAGQRATVSIPVVAGLPGLATIEVVLTPPGGAPLTKTLSLPVQINDPEVARTSRFDLADGSTFAVTPDVFEGLRPGTVTATVALGPLARLDVPGLLRTLDRYPYGCTEQVTSQALPLLYFGPMARALGLDAVQTVDLRLAQAIDQVLARQNSEGGFGLWQTYDGDFWLDAYVTDFLSRARALGHIVPDQAFQRALDNLRNRVNTAPDFGGTSGAGGEDLAYALLVLAREGAAAIGDLRYYADAKAADFGTPLAVAQLGAALAYYGEQPRADALFRRSQTMLGPITDAQVWRADYGSTLRDSAAILALGADAGTDALDIPALVDRVSGPGRVLSPQEAAWSLLAAHALTARTTAAGFTLDGAPVDVPVLRVTGRDGPPRLLRNGSGSAAELTLTTFGVPVGSVQAGGNGYAIDRSYYTMAGVPAEPSRMAQGTRLVTVLTVTPFGGGEARLMVDDPLPAGFEIDNPNLLRSGDIRALDWLDPTEARHAEFRQDRFLAAVDWRSDDAFRLAYIVRAVSPGEYHHPAASVVDMYRPQYRANTDSGRMTIVK